ncbi:M20/M25/M40 family metallo-hydrolase [Candidatus Poribacteria bacterium]|nr:M20/M25/M40 family metallo-hydrolase [Candidatus Poribacteria bacterium]
MGKLDEIIAEVDNVKDELIELHQNLVKIPTVNTGVMPTGNETELCQFLKKKLDAEHIKNEIVESLPTRGNLIARLNSSSRENQARLMFMSHTDVVPIGDETKWKHPPFSGILDNGRIYGRGSNDCKGLTSCEVMATILLKRLNVPLKRSLIMAAGADEETGSKYGFRWLAKNRRREILSDFAINEGGGGCIMTPKGLCWGIAIGEKGRLEARITITGKSCHASVPWVGDNALVKLSKVIQRIDEYKPEIDVSTVIFKEIPRLFAVAESEITPERIDVLIDRIASSNSLIYSVLKGLSRMTVTPTMTKGGIKSNVVPDTYELICDIRVLPGQDIQYVQSELEKTLSDIDGCKVIVSGTTNPSASPSNNEFLNSIKKSLSQVMGRNVETIQNLTVGFTDSSAVRPLGTIVYNFAPSHPKTNQNLNNVHGDNESIAVDDLVFRTKVLVALAYDLVAK